MNRILGILFVLFSFLAMYVVGTSSSHFSYRIFFTGIFITCFSIINIFSKRSEPYSLYKIFFLFSLFFFGIAPLLQSFHNSKFWYLRPLTEDEYFYLNVVLIFIIIFYHIFYTFFRKISIQPKRKALKKWNQPELSFIKCITLVFLSIFSFYIVFASNNYNLIPMFFRGGDMVTEALSNMQESESPTKWLIINNFIRPIAMMSFLYYSISKNKKSIFFIILLILALATCFPTAMPRFAAAAMYIPVILILIPFMRKQNVFSLIFVSGLLVVFPFLNMFRTIKDSDPFDYKFNFEMFTEPHFDSYQNFALVLSHEIVTNGQQLMGVLFFFIPRSIWPNKPLGTGAFAAEKLNFFYENVAANYFAEGYVNFGFFGIFLFLIVLSYYTAKIDNGYWEKNKGNTNTFNSILYTMSLGFLFFILRGDLLSSFAYLIGFIMSAFVIQKILSFKFR